MKNKKYFIQTAISAIIIFGLSLSGIALPDKEFSDRERRYLATFPAVNTEDILSGRFMDSFETYSYDQFTFRETFLNLKSFVTRYVLLKGDDEGYYKKDGYLAKIEYPENTAKAEINANKLLDVYNTYIEGTDSKAYFSLIPDKNYFLGNEYGYPIMDYDKFTDRAKSIFNVSEYIDIMGELDIEDYYKTDPHWRQERILPVADRLFSAMGKTGHGPYLGNEATKDFKGALYSQSGIDAEPEKIEYLSNDILDSALVTDYSSGKPKDGVIYNFDMISSRDPYEFFLSGNQPVQVIESPGSQTEDEIVIFRDSFGSSLAPLFAEKYRKITLIDLRYLNASLIGQFVEFNGQDVLFIYSTSTFNNTI